MKLLLTSAGIKNTSIHDALVDLLGKPIAESSALCIPTAGYGHPMGSPGGAWRFISGRAPTAHVRAGLEVLGRAGAHRAAQHRRRTLGPLGPGDRRPAGEWRRRPVPVPLDAAVRAGGPLAVAARDGLGGTERREHGDDPPHRGGLRRLEAAHRWRRSAGHRRLLDLPAPGSRGPAGEHHGRRRTMGGRHPRSGVRDRRRDRHQSGRRHRRGRLRGALEAVAPQRSRCAGVPNDAGASPYTRAR